MCQQKDTLNLKLRQKDQNGFCWFARHGKSNQTGENLVPRKKNSSLRLATRGPSAQKGKVCMKINLLRFSCVHNIPYCNVQDVYSR